MESHEESFEADDDIEALIDGLLRSAEYQIDRNPDTDVDVISVSENKSSNPPTQPVKVNKNNEYRNDSDSSSDDDDDDSSSSSSDTSSDSDFSQILIDSSVYKKVPIAKTKGELGLEDLPPIEDLVISVQEKEIMLIGKVHAIVGELVVIHAIKDMKPLDLDSVLFLSHDKPLGRVFDIFGPVVEPFYCVRFNNADEIKNKGVEKGSNVFFAPEKSDITTYVFMDDLQKQKGSDASWEHNNEPPEQFLDFSDDEEEKAARRKRMIKNRNRQFSNDSEVASKRPALIGDSSSPSDYKRSAVSESNSFLRHKSFSKPLLPPPSPAPSIVSVPVRHSFNHFSTPGQPCITPAIRPLQSFLSRPPPPLLLTSYPPPPVFGQMALLTPVPSPPPFYNSPVTSSAPTLIPVSQMAMTPQNYFSQRFPRNTVPLPQMTVGNPVFLDQNFSRNISPVSQNQHTSSTVPWLPSRSPNILNVPPNHPLTIQIPNQNNPAASLQVLQQNSVSLQPVPLPNQNNPAVPLHGFQPNVSLQPVPLPNQNNPAVPLHGFQPNVSLQPFVNSNIRFHNVNTQNRFY